MLEKMTEQTSSSSYQYINLEYMELMADGDPEMKAVMLDMLLGEIPDELKKMRTSLDNSSWEELGSLSHKMKSTLAFVGNDVMTHSNKDIEAICKSGEGRDQLPSLMEALETMYPNILEELKIEQTRI